MSGDFANPLAIDAMGGISAVGCNVVQTATSIRAGLAGFREHPYFNGLSKYPDSEPGEPLIVAPVRDVDPDKEGCRRLIDLAAPALMDLAGEAKLTPSDLAESALLLALPVFDERVRKWGIEDTFVHELGRVTGLTEFKLVEENHSGHTGMFELLAKAEQLLQSGKCRFCFVLGVDSYLSPDRLELWDESWRLRSERNADGFIPGEGASALLVESASQARARGVEVLATVDALGLAEEENALASNLASTGSGLCEALEAVIAPGSTARWVCCDLNGESYRAFEWGLAQVRSHEALKDMQVLHHPTQSTGDLGAATGGTLLSHVVYALGRPRPPAMEAILWTSADDGKRAALRVKGAGTD